MGGSVAQCKKANKLPCSIDKRECGGCLKGFKTAGTKCVDKCDAVQKKECAKAHRSSCKPKFAECGDCLKGFKLAGTREKPICVEKCDAAAKLVCAKQYKEPCKKGSDMCGACIKGYKPNCKAPDCPTDCVPLNHVFKK